MSCVDCHLHPGLMGSPRGVEHLHQRQQVAVSCEVCHDEDASTVPWHAAVDPITSDILRQRGQTRPGDEPARMARHGAVVWNLRPPRTATGSWTLHAKSTGRPHPVPPTPRDANHQLDGHARLTCAACHSAWAPTCSTCHVRYDAGGKQWDFAEAKVTPGAFVERAERFEWRAPALAVGADDRIAPAVPGMIARIDPGSGTVHRPRLYARLDPHTTRRQARSCDSCHRSAWALGLGSRRLDITPDGPVFAGGPAPDRWTAVDADTPAAGTRQGLRSLGPDERRRVLVVGACTPCHREADDPIYRSFAKSLRRLCGGSACRGRRQVAWVCRK